MNPGGQGNRNDVETDPFQPLCFKNVIIGAIQYPANFFVVNRFFGKTENFVFPRFYLEKYQDIIFGSNDIDFKSAPPIIGLQDPESAFYQIFDCDRFTFISYFFIFAQYCSFQLEYNVIPLKIPSHLQRKNMGRE